MQQPSDATTSAAAVAANQPPASGAESKDNAQPNEPDGATKCEDVGAVLFKYIAEAREELDELYGAIEEFKDPILLARVASYFSDTPQTPEAQFQFIQARITKAGARMNLVHAAVENWVATRACKRRLKRQLKKNKRTRNGGTRRCDECGKWANQESFMHTTPQWAVCTRCTTRPPPLRCDFCNQEEDAEHQMLSKPASALCLRCASGPISATPSSQQPSDATNAPQAVTQDQK
jgi:hypothetical protein